MKTFRNLPWTAMSVAAVGLLCANAMYAAVPHYLITNNDNSQGNSATFYAITTTGLLKQVAVISTGGTGIDGIGTPASMKRVSILSKSVQDCAYISDAGSNDVAAISIPTLTLKGTFPASGTDNGSSGVGIVNNGSYLYASFASSKTIATYRISAGCKLTFLGDTAAAGLAAGSIIDMGARRNLLVASFGDGSVGSFDISGGTPVANGDLQFSTGSVQDGTFPSGVDITEDGQYAIFGGTHSPELVEVSDISSGKVTPTVVYSNIGSGSGSESIWLSPDETLLYISNFSSSQVTAAVFDKTTGTVSAGCTSSPLKGNHFEAGLATARNFGTGGTLYVAEPDATIGIVAVGGSGGNCTLSESPRSPALDPNSITIESIGAFPPRPF